jgi:prepilin-type processing-associated H-X9-DG protein
MNAWMNPAATPMSQGLSTSGRIFKKQTDISGAIGPSKCWVLLDENDKSINDGWFVVAVTGAIWVDIPGSYHNKAGGLSFADGHAEIKKWRDKYVLSPPALNNIPADSAGNYAELRWLEERSTVPQ